MPFSTNMHTECLECGLPVTIKALKVGNTAVCPRCHYVITRLRAKPLLKISIFSITALIALLFANVFSFITLTVQGQERELTLLQSIETLNQLNYWPLSLFLMVVIFILPVLFVVAANALTFTLSVRKSLHFVPFYLRIIKFFRHWNMAEIYLLGVLISIIKVLSLAEISLGLAFGFFVLFSVMQLLTMMYIDSFQIDKATNEIDGLHPKPKKALLSYDTKLQRAWLFLLTGILLYIPANTLPIMVTNSLGGAQSSTIIGGVLLLWQHGSYPIAVIIFVASIAVPIGKFLALLLLLISEQFNVIYPPHTKTSIYRATEFIGRWSMVDVFVVAFLAGLIQLGNLMSIYPGEAVFAFAGMVIATMLAAQNLDPKQFWLRNE